MLLIASIDNDGVTDNDGDSNTNGDSISGGWVDDNDSGSVSWIEKKISYFLKDKIKKYKIKNLFWKNLLNYKKLMAPTPKSNNFLNFHYISIKSWCLKQQFNYIIPI